MKKPEGMKGESLKSRRKVGNVQNSDETQQDMTEAIRIAVWKAFAEVKIEEKRPEKKKTLYNTRRLMESYIDLKKYINNAITEEEEVTEAAYSVLKGENAKLKSVKEAKMVTAMMIINIDRALTELETESRKEGTLYKYELEELKAYCRIDYDDDDEVIKLIYAAVLEEMTDLIKDFNPEALTNRQKLLICMYVKEAYDNRDRTAPTDDKVRFAVQSMMLKERLK